MLTNTMSSFEEENAQTQSNVWSYRIYLYLHDYKLAIELGRNGHNDKNIDYEVKKRKAIKKRTWLQVS